MHGIAVVYSKLGREDKGDKKGHLGNKEKKKTKYH
jgi:hypothetical protein